MEKVRKCLDELNTKYKRPDLVLAISKPFDTNNSWSHGPWPNYNMPGVYVFADEHNNAVYIGKASSGIAARLSAYWCKGKNGETESKDHKSQGVRYVYTIGLPEDRFFEAPAIEEFLIHKVKPLRNGVGK